MNTEMINKLHADVIESENAADVMVAQLVEQEEKLSELSSRYNCTREIWGQRVVAIGSALNDAKTQVGKGWKHNFDTLGYAFSFTTASRYVACAKHPQLSEDNLSVEEWARASAAYDRNADPAKVIQEENRKERAASRAVKAVQIANAEKQSPAEQMDAVDAHREEIVAETNVQSELHLAFWSLDKAIRNDKRFHVLLPHWEVLVAGIHQRHLPRPRVVSLVDSDDLVEMGESQHVA